MGLNKVVNTRNFKTESSDVRASEMLKIICHLKANTVSYVLLGCYLKPSPPIKQKSHKQTQYAAGSRCSSCFINTIKARRQHQSTAQEREKIKPQRDTHSFGQSLLFLQAHYNSHQTVIRCSTLDI